MALFSHHLRHSYYLALSLLLRGSISYSTRCYLHNNPGIYVTRLVCVCLYVYVRVFVRICVWSYVRACVSTCVLVWVRVCVYEYVCACVCTCVSTCMRECILTCVREFVCVCECVRVCMWVHEFVRVRVRASVHTYVFTSVRFAFTQRRTLCQHRLSDSLKYGHRSTFLAGTASTHGP